MARPRDMIYVRKRKAFKRKCFCGCNEWVWIPEDYQGRPARYVNDAHKQRAYRNRQAHVNGVGPTVVK